MDIYPLQEAWPEAPAPEEARDCNRCSLATHHSRFIWGEGNPVGPVMIILDNPGAREDRSGLPFVCSARIMLRRALEQGGLDAGLVYITYILKCRPRRAYDRAICRDSCLPHLWRQIRETAPQLLVCMGNVVLQTLFSRDAEVREYRGSWLQLDGIPAMITYHPLAAKRRPNLMQYLVADFRAVRIRLRYFSIS